ncbi:hypothetical protein P3T76_000243 [Phytophthora citrophthora]|uniref:Uncharacterized protein n=1 Tax=Phytophthora citrophthora TaxID=4793 RepID=A0AAD9H193_9STRA|nr:hypothetical protein P3T76_000243 [Phytophthora citrophthora]
MQCDPVHVLVPGWCGVLNPETVDKKLTSGPVALFIASEICCLAGSLTQRFELSADFTPCRLVKGSGKGRSSSMDPFPVVHGNGTDDGETDKKRPLELRLRESVGRRVKVSTSS